MTDHISALTRFAAYARNGAWREAVAAASAACHAAPHLAQPHYAYGEAWLALGEAERAEQAFAAALRIDPAWADAWVNFGITRYRQGAIEDAKQAMHRALDAVPFHAAAITNLGAFMRLTGEAERGEALLRATLAREPDNVGARLNMAADLLADERAEEALAQLDAVFMPRADLRALRHWHLQTSLALLQLHRLAEARSVLEALAEVGPIPPEIAPLWLWRQVMLAASERRLAAAGQAAQCMAVALDAMGPEGVLEHQIMGHYDLAKFWSGQNEQAVAFAHWTAGHALLKRVQPFSRDAHLAFIEANMAEFSAGQSVAAADADPSPIFIVGMPRSGTTLCEQILAAHGQAHGAGERHALPRAFRRLGDGNDDAAVRRIAALDYAAIAQAGEEYLKELHALAPDKRRIIDKMPGNYLYLGLVGRMLPGARIIHCVRDPRDIGLSIYTFRFHGDHGYAHDLADLGWAIVQQERLMEHWHKVLPGAILTVKLSDWVGKFDHTLARVLAHVGLPNDPNCARFHEVDRRVRTVSRAQVRQPVNARGLGRWQAYARQLSPLIEELEKGGALEQWQVERT